GKTGTCSENGTRLGWFFSYTDQIKPRVVVAVLLRGRNRIVGGGTAAEIAGRVYARLRESGYFAQASTAPPSSAADAPR
ncbi:MAG TPA: penicillin-binding protein, partial [Candidatus Nitrosotenuis sp.]|nr:penicillin-binding protein [Candidatus Nitrosotenuis sp.]